MPNGNQQQQIMQAVAQELQKGTDPRMIIQQLVKMKVPQDQAMKIVDYVSKQMQASGSEEQMSPQMAEGGSAGGQEEQMMQIMQKVAEMLQTMPPEQVMQQLVQMGMSQEQAAQIIQMVMQQMKGGGGGAQGPQEEMMEGPQGQNPQEEAAEGQMPMQMYGGRMKRGGTPCYNCGGMYANGGSTYSGNTWFGQGGAYVPSYGEFAYGGFNEIPSLFTKQPDRAAYGGAMPYKRSTFAKGGQPGASLKIGQEMDVTPEQLDHLRSLGYQIKMI